MAVKFTKLADGAQLGTTSSTLYTAPANTTTKISDVTVCNTTTVARTVTVYVVESGGAANAASTIYSAFPVGPKETVTLSDLTGFVLEAADTLRGLADAATAVSIQASGVQIT
jgi:hypothetical protein